MNTEFLNKIIEIKNFLSDFIYPIKKLFIQNINNKYKNCNIKFSIIIPTLQKDKYILTKLLESLNQDKYIGEIIIIDNAQKGLSFDSDKIKIITPEQNIYVNPSWNLGIKNIKNEYFGILNDDILLPDNLLIQIYDFIQKTKDCGLIGLESSTVMDNNDKNFNKYPQKNICKFKKFNDIHKNKDYYWGTAIFGKKENYYEIPKDILIWSGDNYLILKNQLNGKQNYAISNINVKHYKSLSSNTDSFKNIKYNDKKIFNEIKNKLLQQNK